MTEQLGVALREQADLLLGQLPAPAVGVVLGAARRRRRVRAAGAAALAVLLLGGAGAVVAPGPERADRVVTVPRGESVVPDEARLREAFRQLDPPVELGPTTVEEDRVWDPEGDGSQVLRKRVSAHDPGDNISASTPAVAGLRGSLSVDWYLVEPGLSDEQIPGLQQPQGRQLDTGVPQTRSGRAIARSLDDDLFVRVTA